MQRVAGVIARKEEVWLLPRQVVLASDGRGVRPRYLRICCTAVNFAEWMARRTHGLDRVIPRSARAIAKGMRPRTTRDVVAMRRTIGCTSLTCSEGCRKQAYMGNGAIHP